MNSGVKKESMSKKWFIRKICMIILIKLQQQQQQIISLSNNIKFKKKTLSPYNLRWTRQDISQYLQMCILEFKGEYLQFYSVYV